MIAEQSVVCRYKASESQAVDVEIQMTIQLQSPGDDSLADVTIGHEYAQPFADFDLWDMLRQRMNNDVHGGIWLPVSPNNVVVKILELKVTPLPQPIEEATARFNLGYLLEVTVSGIVETLCRSLENLRSGKESYLEWPELPPDVDEENA